MSTGFSWPQQKKFRLVVAEAWAVVGKWVQDEGRDEDTWRRDVLESATGKRTTKECNVTTDFEAAMMAFKRLCGDSIFWEVYGEPAAANLRRIQWAMEPFGFEVPREYAEAIALEVCGVGLAELDAGGRREVIARLVMQARRQRERGQDTDQPRRREKGKFLRHPQGAPEPVEADPF